jgi:hypothetical protein
MEMEALTEEMATEDKMEMEVKLAAEVASSADSREAFPISPAAATRTPSLL